MTSQPGGMRLRPMGLGDILDESIRLYRRHVVTFVSAMAIYAVALALSQVAGSVFTFDFEGDRFPTTTELVGAFVIQPLIHLAAMLAATFSGAVVTQLASNAILGRSLELGAACRLTMRRVPSLLWMMFLVGLAAMLLSITVVGIPFAIYLVLGWMLATPAIVLEGLGGRAALRRSAQLVQGRRWRMLGFSVLMTLLVSILTLVPNALVVGALGGSPEWIVDPSASTGIALAVTTLVYAVATALFGSLYPIGLTVLYYDLRVRDEAFDLEQRAGEGAALTVTPAATPA